MKDDFELVAPLYTSCLICGGKIELPYGSLPKPFCDECRKALKTVVQKEKAEQAKKHGIMEGGKQ